MKDLKTKLGLTIAHVDYRSLKSEMIADPDADDRNILTVPLYHIAGVQAVMAAIYGGRTMIIQRQFEPYLP